MTGQPGQARPTHYSGILMRSRLEADYARMLDRSPQVTSWKYEPACFAGPAGQWLPDFWFTASHIQRQCYVEVKPMSWLRPRAGERVGDHLLRLDELLGRMAMAWLTDPDLSLFLHFHEYGASAAYASVYSHGQDMGWFCANCPFITRWALPLTGPGAP